MVAGLHTHARLAMGDDTSRPPGRERLYEHAIIYELHVRAFQDSNADDIGDFPGLTSRLGYLRDLGVSALWLRGERSSAALPPATVTAPARRSTRCVRG